MSCRPPWRRGDAYSMRSRHLRGEWNGAEGSTPSSDGQGTRPGDCRHPQMSWAPRSPPSCLLQSVAPREGNVRHGEPQEAPRCPGTIGNRDETARRAIAAAYLIPESGARQSARWRTWIGLAVVNRKPRRLGEAARVRRRTGVTPARRSSEANRRQGCGRRRGA